MVVGGGGGGVVSEEENDGPKCRVCLGPADQTGVAGAQRACTSSMWIQFRIAGWVQIMEGFQFSARKALEDMRKWALVTEVVGV